MHAHLKGCLFACVCTCVYMCGCVCVNLTQEHCISECWDQSSQVALVAVQNQCILFFFLFLLLCPPSIHFDFGKLMLTVLSSALCSRQHCLSISLQFKWPAFWQGLFPITGNDISFRLHHSSFPLWAPALGVSLSLCIFFLPLNTLSVSLYSFISQSAFTVNYVLQFLF